MCTRRPFLGDDPTSSFGRDLTRTIEIDITLNGLSLAIGKAKKPRSLSLAVVIVRQIRASVYKGDFGTWFNQSLLLHEITVA